MKFNKAFKRWFGDSVVVDSKGRPLQVCHASREDFNIFRIPRLELGAHFGTHSQCETFESRIVRKFYLSIENPFRLVDSNTWTASNIIKYNKTLPKQLAMEILVRKGKFRDPADAIVDLRQWFDENGFDGVVYLNRQEGLSDESYNKIDILPSAITDAEVLRIAPEAEDSFIVWHPEQVKLADNDGTWDLDDPDIRSNPRGQR